MKAVVIATELKAHAPFTTFGTVTGIVIMAAFIQFQISMGTSIDVVTAILVAVFLFLAVWVPCCTSDIVFPLLWIKKNDAEIVSPVTHGGAR
ncbi:MAG: hypothetical protein WA096_04890 [Smithella sp.]